MKRLVALGFVVVFGLAALGARPAQAAPDRLGPFLGQFQGQSGQAPGSLYIPLWSKPMPFDLAVERHNDELVFAIGGTNSVIMRFVPVSDRLYVLRTNSGVPSSVSSARIDADKPDCEICSSSAARVK